MAKRLCRAVICLVFKNFSVKAFAKPLDRVYQMTHAHRMAVMSDGGENLDDDGSDLGLGGSWASSHSHHRTDSTGYSVRFPPENSLLDDFSTAHVFPVLDWGRRYTLDDFKGDLVAGLTIASLCIPQDIGYSKLANLPPEIGLSSSFVPPLIYPLMGSSRDIAMGPVAVVSLMLGTLMQNEIDPKKPPLEYRRLAFTATFFAGITQAALGFFRLGFIIEFLSHAAIVGFMSGAAITIALQQLKGFLGIRNFTARTDIVSVMKSIFKSAHHGWNWQTILIGASFLGFLLVTKYIGKKKKNLFWMSAIAPLVSVILSTFFVYITRADRHGVAVVKNIEKGVNPPSASLIYFSGPFLLKGLKIGVVTGLIALTEAVAIGRTFAAMKDYPLDGNKEMVALGTMNVVANSVAKILVQATRPKTALLGNLPRTTVYRNIEQYPEVTTVPGVIIVQVDSAIYFTNSNYVKERILRWLNEEEERQREQKFPGIEFLIVDLSPVGDIDTSGIHALEELFRTLEKRKIQLILANPGPAVIQKLRSAKFTELIGDDKISLTVRDAVKKLTPKAADCA
ncbi:unnamed protein product [Miscanthus lutarioriparius]|uniref:STAS domain-containing protein n=1 Tax=Miscanthus lutarioriparius TaxID=422564 RepID=A0A811ML17_9POAL|nr:unnamed protein product [Miscanthus lutarioriparius]